MDGAASDEDLTLRLNEVKVGLDNANTNKLVQAGAPNQREKENKRTNIDA